MSFRFSGCLFVTLLGFTHLVLDVVLEVDRVMVQHFLVFSQEALSTVVATITRSVAQVLSIPVRVIVPQSFGALT